MKGFGIHERDVSRQVKDFLEWRGWRMVRMNVTKMKDKAGQWIQFGENGMADYLALYYMPNERPGAALAMWVEIKGPGGKLSPDQVTWHGNELACGGCVVVAREFTEFEAWYWEQFSWLHKQQGQQHLFSQAQ
jgi:hypothetical protein